MLRATTFWEEGVPLQATPMFFNVEHARPEKLKEVPRLRRCRADMTRTRRPVLDVQGQCLEVRHEHVARGILVDVPIGHLTCGHHLWRWQWRGGRGREGRREGGSWR
jgi:hypothetical protein